MLDAIYTYILNYPDELKYLLLLTQRKNTYISTLKFRNDLDQKLFLSLIQKHKLLPHISKALNEDQDFFQTNVSPNIKTPDSPFSQELVSRLQTKQKAITKQMMTLTREMVLLTEELNNKEIPHLFIKGPVLSQLLYDDPFKKDSIDLDLLIPFEYLEQTHAKLVEKGYRMTYPRFSLNKAQQTINYKISHHYNFFHQQKRVMIELHWKLINPYTLLPVPFSELYKNAQTVSLNQYAIKTLSIEDYFLYLAVHGSKHRWYNLAWLKDFSQLIQISSETTISKSVTRALRMGFHKPIIQAFILSHTLFGTTVPKQIEELYKQEKHIDSFIMQALQAINEPARSVGSSSGNITKLTYNFQLRKRIGYKLTLIFRLRTHHRDWEILRLPGWLFFLYYPLRPVLFIIRILKKK